MIVQIPLVVRNAETWEEHMHQRIIENARREEANSLCLCMPPQKRGMRDAAIKPSRKSQGPFTGLEKVKLDRDPHGPIRVTMQIYKVMLISCALQLTSSLTSLRA